MHITISDRLEQFIKDTFNVTDAAPIVQKVLSDWMGTQMMLRASKELSADEILTVLEKKRKDKVIK